MTTVKTSLWAGLWSVALACGTPLTPSAEGPAAETPSPAASSSLRVVSWNVEFLDAPGRGRNGRSAEQLGSMARDLAALEADIVVLQEVASAEAVQAIAQKWMAFTDVIISEKAAAMEQKRDVDFEQYRGVLEELLEYYPCVKHIFWEPFLSVRDMYWA